MPNNELKRASTLAVLYDEVVTALEEPRGSMLTKDIAYVIHELDLDPRQYCVVGGAMMQLYGLRDCRHDIDLLAQDCLFDQKAVAEPALWVPAREEGSGTHGELFCVDNRAQLPITLLRVGSFPMADQLRMAIEESEWMHIIGHLYLPVIRKPQMLDWKRAANRPKDQEDIKLLEEAIKNGRKSKVS